jgi:hypothetical protein
VLLIRTGNLDITEVRYLVHAVWNFHPSRSCLYVLKKLNLNTDGIVNVAEFVLLNKHHKELLKPLRKIKVRLQKQTVFKRFWEQLCRRRIEMFGQLSMYQICDRVDSAYLISSMEYLNLRTDVVPPEFIEQWNYVQRKKKLRGTLHTELPYEIMEVIKPIPKNIPRKKRTLKNIVRGVRFMNRMRDGKTAIVNSDPEDSDHEKDPAEGGVGDELSGGVIPPLPMSLAVGGNFDRDGDEDDDRFNNTGTLSTIKTGPKGFDDSFLGSLKNTEPVRRSPHMY